MKKTILTVAILVFAQIGQAATTSVICSSAGGNVTVLTNSITVMAAGLMGWQKIQLANEDLNISSVILQQVSKSETELDSICGKKYSVRDETTVKEITFSKKDGSDIFTDDTPQSSIKEIKTKILCDTRVVDEWPCN